MPKSLEALREKKWKVWENLEILRREKDRRIMCNDFCYIHVSEMGLNDERPYKQLLSLTDHRTKIVTRRNGEIYEVYLYHIADVERLCQKKLVKIDVDLVSILKKREDNMRLCGIDLDNIYVEDVRSFVVKNFLKEYKSERNMGMIKKYYKAALLMQQYLPRMLQKPRFLQYFMDETNTWKRKPAVKVPLKSSKSDIAVVFGSLCCKFRELLGNKDVKSLRRAFRDYAFSTVYVIPPPCAKAIKK